jgi:hypothetical protein
VSTPAGNAVWFHCFAGIAGDMAFASLLDAGADAAEVLDAATAALSALVLGFALVRHEDVRVVGALLGACSGMALIGLLVALLEAFGRQGWALTTAALAAAPLVLHELGLGLGSRGASVGVSVLVGLLVSAWTVRYFLEDPHRTLVVSAL